MLVDPAPFSPDARAAARGFPGLGPFGRTPPTQTATGLLHSMRHCTSFLRFMTFASVWQLVYSAF
jgi:hypothetical protein